MNTKLKVAAACLVTAGLLGCGSPDDVELIECGDGTVEEDGQCIPHAADDCDEDEVLDEVLGECVRAAHDYCGAGTEFDADRGQCVGEQLECDEEAEEVDGECVADTDDVECGDGTVVVDGQCRIEDEVCGEGTELVDGTCSLDEDVCGEGTSFDAGRRVCVADTDLECGPGTELLDDQCVDEGSFYEGLTKNPDLELTDEDGIAEFDLPDEGDRFVFTGTIESPQYDGDDQPVQYEDVLQFDADGGDWVRVVVYSMGLPEPGYRFEQIDGDYLRHSDIGAGIEVGREFVIQQEDTHQLTISNLPQLMEEAPAAGGENWEYVGYVEHLETPEPKSFGLLDDTIAGDIRALTENYYEVDAQGIESVAMIFDALPDGAEAQLQVWTDETTYESTEVLDEDAFSFQPPADTFYLIFDRVQAFGPETGYSVSAQTGQPLDDGAMITEDIELEADDYVGLFQYNLQGEPMDAKIVDGADVLENTSSLEVYNAEEGRLGLYHFAESAATVTLELENTTGDDLGFVAFEPVTGSASQLDGVDGNRAETNYVETLPRGQRHYYRLDVDYTGDLSLRVEDTNVETQLTLMDDDQNVIDDGINAVIFDAEPGEYLAYVEASHTMADGFAFVAEETQLYTESETSAPGLSIPDNDPDGVSDALIIGSCPYIADVEVEVNITHPWRSDLVVDVESPQGDIARLHDRSGGSTDDINATYPYPENTGAGAGDELDDGEQLLDLIGTNGSGTWTIYVSDNEHTQEGTLDNWGVELQCEG